ncbi:MAG: SGNH/GDSL hydrolase family protein [Desulfobacteraceae bacterium]|nr:SGNH/GDSL hydrolase family protein [Desulfobacteraceae bacterium]
MIKKIVLLVIVASVLCVAAFLVGGDMFKKTMPYDIEVVPQKDRVAFFNKTEWMNKDLKIACRDSHRRKGTSMLPGDLKQAVVTGLAPGETYTFSIGRTDLLGWLRYKKREITVTTIDSPYIVLVGASVGKSWDFPGLPERLHDDRFVFGYRGGKQGFDKTDALHSLIEGPVLPDAIIIKECAAYFPRDVEEGLDQIKRWIAMLRNQGITPILATCTPVTPENDSSKPGRQAAINAFNEHIRDFDQNESLAVLDLQQALGDGSDMHFLRQDFARPDGLHLTEKAYQEALDPIVLPMLSALYPARQ